MIARTLIVAASLLLLSACNYLTGDDGLFPDRRITYQEAQMTPDLVVPPELDSYTLDQLYVIPEQANLTATAFEEIPLPRPIEPRRREGVVIQRLTENAWILIDATPGQVWPLVRDYWTELQIALDYENPGTGIMETAWLEIGEDETLRHKYRLAIEPGLHSGYSEIYVTHLQQERSVPIPAVVTWPEVSDSEDLEMDVMTSISQYLADRNDVYQASSASLLAGSIEAASKANIIQTDEGNRILELRLDYDRAWVQVRQAVEDAGIEILDSNKEQNFINVRFAGIASEQADQPGFFGRLFGRGDDEEIREPQDFAVRLLESDGTVNVVTEALVSAGEDNQLAVDLLQTINDNLS